MRKGNTFTAQHSEDGETWKDVQGTSSESTEIQPAVVEVEMDDPVRVGLAVCSHLGASLAIKAKISQVSLAGGWSISGQFTSLEEIGFESSGKSQ